MLRMNRFHREHAWGRDVTLECQEQTESGRVGMGFLIAPLVLGAIGYLLRFRHWGWLVSGYNTSSKEAKARDDVVALTRGVGNFTFLLAAIQVVAGIGFLAGLDWVPVAAMVSLVVASVVFIVYANTGRRYMKNP